MQAKDLYEYLGSRSYPGRGIVIARTPCGRKMRIAYFIMGRSENSRNRIFIETEDGIRTEAYDISKLVDPSLIIYSPVRKLGNTLIVTNGDQTDTIYKNMQVGKTFEEALRLRTFEPDEPNYTPRISAVVNGFDYQMSILKSAEGNPNSTYRYFFDYTEELPGHGHIIHTYQNDKNPLPSFEGEPVRFKLVKEPFEAFAQHVWESLNADNKISLYVTQIEPGSDEVKTIIFNKNQ